MRNTTYCVCVYIYMYIATNVGQLNDATQGQAGWGGGGSRHGRDCHGGGGHGGWGGGGGFHGLDCHGGGAHSCK